MSARARALWAGVLLLNVAVLAYKPNPYSLVGLGVAFYLLVLPVERKKKNDL